MLAGAVYPQTDADRNNQTAEETGWMVIITGPANHHRNRGKWQTAARPRYRM